LDPKDKAGHFREEKLKEKVLINPAVLTKGYVSKGQTVFIITPNDPGKPGKGLNGQPLSPPNGEAKGYFLGQGLRREPTLVVAEDSGFLRIGKNWVDLLHFDAHSWSIELSKDKTNCYLNFTPGNPKSPKVSVEELFEAIEKEGFDLDRLIDKDQIASLLEQAVSLKKTLSQYPLTPSEEGGFAISPTVDNLKVYLNITKASGKGKKVEVSQIENELKVLGIKNLDIPKVLKKVESFLKSPLLKLEDFLLIQGTHPTRGKDRTVEYLVDFAAQNVQAAILARAKQDAKLLDGAKGLLEFPIEKVEKVSEVRAGQEVAILKQAQGSEGKPGKDVFGNPIPPYPGNDPVIHIFGDIKRNGDIIYADKDGLLEMSLAPDGIFMRIRRHKSGQVIIHRSEDNMEAFLTLEEALGTGEPLSLERIEEMLELEQIRNGIKTELLPKALERAKSVGVLKNVLIARGTPPGSDLLRRVKLNYPVNAKKPAEVKKGQIQRIGVKEGQLVALYDPPEVKDGVDVLGNRIPVNQEEVKELQVGSNLTVKPKTGTNTQEIYAQTAGELVFDGESLQIRNKLVISGDVGPKSGNLKFPGEVLVQGGVEKGFYVMTGGFLRVAGPVEEALLSSEDGIALESAFRGNDKGVIRAKKDIRTPYVEKATILAVGNIIVGKATLNCKIKCSGVITQKDPTGTLVGGQIKTKLGLVVQNLGNAKGVSTFISFGQDYLIEDHVETQEKELDKIRTAIMKLDQMMPNLTRPEDKPKLFAARRKKVQAMKALEKKGIALINLRDKFEAHFKSSITVHGTIYPGVTIESHGRIFKINEKRSQVKITFDMESGKIQETPLKKAEN
jgi:uncharacterized protein (DUF342 family)